MIKSVTPRRNFLKSVSLAAAAISVMPSQLFAGQPPVMGKLSLVKGETGVHVPADFIGLSYENMQLEDPGFFSPANTGLVAQFRSVSARGVLRLGGNTSEFGWWKAMPDQQAPKRNDSPWKAAGEPVRATMFSITPEAIDNLNGFLLATGWSCIYGLNLGYGTPETDIAEAVYVANKLGSRLQYFQVGNEVDLFKGHLRNPDTWNPRRYLDEWLTIARAVQKVLPSAKFGMPDVAADVTWLPQLAELWGPVAAKPNLVTMSHHYYWNGPPSNPEATIDNLLKTDPKVAAFAKMSSDASKQIGAGVTLRMTEGNTVYRGGKSGVSDVFAAALWGADYLLQLMSLGYCGVNLHGGSGHAQAVSVGGVFHGEALMKDPTVPHPKPFYTPIANEGTLAGAGVNGRLNGNYILEPVGYGMKFVAGFAGATMLPLNFDSGTVNASAYGATKGGTRMIVILNKDEAQSLSVSLPPFEVVSRLEAAALDSHDAHIIASTVQHGKRAADRTLVVPPHTAIIIHLKG